MKTQEDAKTLAINVMKFIKHNNIDMNKFSMDEIVEGYFKAQLNAIDEVGLKILNNENKLIENYSSVKTTELTEDIERIVASFEFAEQFDQSFTIARHTHTDGTHLSVSKINGSFIISDY